MRVLEAAVSLNEADVDGFDEVCVVEDVDEHQSLADALVEARKRSIPVVVSNPCFEIWLLWHYEDCAGHRAAKQLVARLQKLGHDAKGIPSNFPFARHEEALQRAMVREVGHTTKGPNPSSGMPHLLAALKRRP